MVDVEEAPEGKKNRSTNRFVKFSGLSHKQENQSDSKLVCIMFHKVASMYRDVKLEEAQA